MNNTIYEVKNKTCISCGESKEATTVFFNKNHRYSDGFEGKCKICKKEYMKKWREKNKEHVLEYGKRHYEENIDYYRSQKEKWYEKNKEHALEYARKYAEENKESLAKSQKKYRENNKEKRRKQSSEWRDLNRDKIKAYNKKNNKKNRPLKRMYQQRRRAMERELPYTLTEQQWDCIKEKFDNSCAYCGLSDSENRERFNRTLEQDHFVPLSKGGGYTQENIIPSCQSCNASKNNKVFSEWYPTYVHYDKHKEKRILYFLGH